MFLNSSMVLNLSMVLNSLTWAYSCSLTTLQIWEIVTHLFSIVSFAWVKCNQSLSPTIRTQMITSRWRCTGSWSTGRTGSRLWCTSTTSPSSSTAPSTSSSTPARTKSSSTSSWKVLARHALCNCFGVLYLALCQFAFALAIYTNSVCLAITKLEIWWWMGPFFHPSPTLSGQDSDISFFLY